MTEQHLRMDDAARRLEAIVKRARNLNALLAVLVSEIQLLQLTHNLSGLLDVLLSEAQVIESELSNLTTLADNWRYVAEKMNGVDPAHPVE